MTEKLTGILTEVGGPEIGSTGKEKPRKIVIKQNASDQYGKTLRVWSNEFAFQELQQRAGQPVTVEFVVEDRQGPQGPYQQNRITDVLPVEGNGERTGAGGSVSAPQPSPPAQQDWSIPKPDVGAGGSPTEHPTATGSPTPAPTTTRDDYWAHREILDQQRSLEMEAAWSVKSVLDREPNISEQKLIQDAIRLIIIKRQVASEMAE